MINRMSRLSKSARRHIAGAILLVSVASSALAQASAHFGPLLRGQRPSGSVASAGRGAIQTRRLDVGDSIFAIPLVPSCEDQLTKLDGTVALLAVEYRGHAAVPAGDTLVAEILDRVVGRPIGGFADEQPVFGLVLRLRSVERNILVVPVNGRAVRETSNAFLPASRLVDVAPDAPRKAGRKAAKDLVWLGSAYALGMATFFDVGGQQGVGHGPAGLLFAVKDRLQTFKADFVSQSLMCVEPPPSGPTVGFRVLAPMELP